MLQEFRCSKCNKLLGKIDGKAEIVCTRCKVLNKFNSTGREVLRYPAWYSDQWKQLREKDADNAASCSECRELRYDGETTRCRSYGNAIIPNADEKHCKDSVR